ncbi:proline-, glutamic acid- and leucine-rich protein 1 [Elysia marginata]|uniref:Proline-, glutamic acid- and leucine-rich protein 1 n=1 Tax=Elysia marginata TaxID=1093978 RepID=A0AAV4JR98_9GAST|nr:proline-, glutamic acid- and leucine-rich protein 1 [Elysia marginata]
MDVASNHYLRDFMAPRKAEEWNKCIHNLIKQMHQKLSLLYENVEEISEPPNSTIHNSSEDATKAGDVPFSDVVETFVKHCDSLCLLLRTPTKWPVKLPMNSVLKVLARCLKVSSTDLKSKPSLSELADALPDLHGSVLLVFLQLITCCGSNVLPQSRVIVDASLRTLSGAKHAKDESKSITRGKAYQVLCSMVEKFGFGRHLQSLCHLLMPEMVSDICTKDAPKTNSSTTTPKPKQEIESIAQRKGKKRKKGKKQKGDSYSDLPVCATEDTGNSLQAELCNVEATEAALELSHLVIERAEFSQVQTLIRSLLQMCKDLQRESISSSSPYTLESCRKTLYSAVFSCATVRLGPDCDRKDTIGHYQLTSLAMSLLITASHSDSSSRVQESCKEFLVLLRNTGNLNRAIVRRVLPDEQMQAKDIAEVEREAERLCEENKSLWKQLVDTQLDVEAQRRELVQLRQSLILNKNVESDIRDENTNKSNKENTTVEEEDEESADDTGVNIPVDQNESNLSEKKTNQPETESEVSAQTVQKEASDLHLETSSTPVVPSEEFANEKTASTTVEVTGKHKKVC